MEGGSRKSARITAKSSSSGETCDTTMDESGATTSSAGSEGPSSRDKDDLESSEEKEESEKEEESEEEESVGGLPKKRKPINNLFLQNNANASQFDDNDTLSGDTLGGGTTATSFVSVEPIPNPLSIPPKPSKPNKAELKGLKPPACFTSGKSHSKCKASFDKERRRALYAIEQATDQSDIAEIYHGQLVALNKSTQVFMKKQQTALITTKKQLADASLASAKDATKISALAKQVKDLETEKSNAKKAKQDDFMRERKELEGKGARLKDEYEYKLGLEEKKVKEMGDLVKELKKKVAEVEKKASDVDKRYDAERKQNGVLTMKVAELTAGELGANVLPTLIWGIRLHWRIIKQRTGSWRILPRRALTIWPLKTRMMLRLKTGLIE